MTGKDLILIEEGFWHHHFEEFVKKYERKQIPVSRQIGNVAIEDLIIITPINIGDIDPRLFSEWKIAFEMPQDKADKVRKRKKEWLRLVTCQLCNEIGHHDNHHGELFITESGWLIQIFDENATFAWRSNADDWESGFLSFLKGDEPTFLGNGFDYIHKD